MSRDEAALAASRTAAASFASRPSKRWRGTGTEIAATGPPGSRTAALAMNNRVVRRLALPEGLPPGLARHCAEEYANLAAILPALHRAYGGEDTI